MSRHREGTMEKTAIHRQKEMMLKLERAHDARVNALREARAARALDNEITAHARRVSDKLHRLVERLEAEELR
jgi:hypothetical protein